MRHEPERVGEPVTENKSMLSSTSHAHSPARGRMAELVTLSAGRASSLMRAGEVSAEEYASALIARAEMKHELNAFISFDAEHVLNAARAADQLRISGKLLGPLHGVPIPVKDSVLTVDYPTSAGNRALQNLSARQDALVIKRLKASGGIVMGKTNLHELSFGYTSENETFGAVRNPYNPMLVAGGSSGGTAAAIASGMAPVGIAEDTGGSVRVPAALCGIIGFRPTTGRYPTTDVVPLTPAFDQIGPEARAMTDIVLMDSVLAAKQTTIEPTRLDKVRLGVPRAYLCEQLEPEVAKSIDQALSTLSKAGVTIVDVEIPNLRDLLDQVFLPVLLSEMHGVLERFLDTRGFTDGVKTVVEQAGPLIRARIERVVRPGAPAAILREEYDNAVARARPALRRSVLECLGKNELDALVFPTTPCVATPVGALDLIVEEAAVPIGNLLGRNTRLAPCCELPGLTIPAGMTRHGLPVGIEFDGAPGSDDALLALGLSLERALSVSSDPVLF